MKKLLLPVMLALAASSSAQLRPQTLEEAAARRWTEMNTDRIAGTADGQGITMSDVRRQIEPVIGQIRASVRSDAEFDRTVKQAADEILRNMADRQVVLASFRSGTGQLPASFVDADIEETVRRDFGGDRSRYVSSLRAAGMTPLSHRKLIEDRIIFEYMVSQVRRSAMTVPPGKLAAYYEAHRAEFERKEQVKLGRSPSRKARRRAWTRRGAGPPAGPPRCARRRPPSRTRSPRPAFAFRLPIPASTTSPGP